MAKKESLNDMRKRLRGQAAQAHIEEETPAQIDPTSDIEQYDVPRSNKPSPAVSEKEAPALESKKQPSNASEPVKQSEKPAVELASLFAKIPKDEKRWLDHHRIDTGKELGQIITEAIQLLKNQDKK